MNKIDNPLARLTKKKRESTYINRIRNERGKITTDTPEVQRTLREYYENSYGNKAKLENVEEMDNILEKYNLPRPTQEETENLNRPIVSKEIELVSRKLPKNQTTGPDGLTGEFYRRFSEDQIPILLKVSPKRRRRGNTPKLIQ